MTIVSKSTVDVETGASIYKEGVYCFTYIGEADEPVASADTSWEDLTNMVIEEHSVPTTKAVVVDYDSYDFGISDGVRDILAVADALSSAAKKLEEHVRSGNIFIRERWENDGMPQGKFDDYCVSYEEYLDYVMEKTK